MPEVSIAAAMREELAATAELHERALDSGLFPALGRRFLARYHATFLESPHALALVAREDGRTVGFLVGTVDNAAHYRWTVRHRGVRLAVAALGAMLVRPAVAWRFLRTRLGRYRRALVRHLRPERPAVAATDGGGSDPDRRARSPQPTAVLTHVATDVRRRSAGVGRRLCDRFLAEAARRGAGEARCITSVEDGVPGFYARLGWTRVADRRAHDGRRVREFRTPLPSQEPV